MPTHDTIRTAVLAAAARRGMTAYAIAKATNRSVSDDMLRRYFVGKSSLTSEKLSAVFSVLGLKVEDIQPDTPSTNSNESTPPVVASGVWFTSLLSRRGP